MTPKSSNGWDKYQLLVMNKLDEHGNAIKGLGEKIDNLPEKCPYKVTIRNNSKLVRGLQLKVAKYTGVGIAAVAIVDIILRVAL